MAALGIFWGVAVCSMVLSGPQKASVLEVLAYAYVACLYLVIVNSIRTWSEWIRVISFWVAVSANNCSVHALVTNVLTDTGSCFVNLQSCAGLPFPTRRHSCVGFTNPSETIFFRKLRRSRGLPRIAS